MPESAPGRIDVRGPRFAAAITSVLLLIDIVLGLVGLSTARATVGWIAYQPLSGNSYRFGPEWAVQAATVGQRATDPAFLLLAVIAGLFLWGVLSQRTTPWSVLFRRVVQPRLSPPTEFEDPRPPRFAQGVGLFVSVVGLVLHLAGVPWGLPIAAAVAFLAAFLNAAFGLCLGCQLYLLMQRVGIIGRARATHA